MSTESIEREIEIRREILKKLSDQRSDASDSELSVIIQKQLAVNQEIADLEWKLLSSEEKQNYRKTILNASKKWGSVKGSNPLEDKTGVLELIIKIYSLSDDILKFEQLPKNIKDVLASLKNEIDRNKYVG
ncbi:MAG: hypothetical protein ACI9V1_002144 [Spirosomataceae bacterium]|jgi:hypothetical protein